MNHPVAGRDVGAANFEFARTLVSELRTAGVAAAVVCPGSRSSPLTLAIARERGLEYTVHIDERSAAFHALGRAKADGRPVALVCTSGTAGANFAPAVAEACHARVPLIVLTADRPPELRAWSAPQTMEQRLLYAGFTRWSEEAPCPSEDIGPGYARALARRAVAEAIGPAPGPVHLNLPFREPLLPSGPIAAESLAPSIGSQATVEPGTTCDEAVTEGFEVLAATRQGVVVCGADPWNPSLPAAVQRMADAFGWPVLGDPASGLRAGAVTEAALIAGADLLLRHEPTAAALRPELVIRIGGPPTSKAVNQWMARHMAAEVWLVDPAGGYRDPQHRATRRVRMSPQRFCELAARIAPEPSADSLAWRARWQQADRIARAAVVAMLERDTRLLTPQLARALWSLLPAEALLYAGNSMAVRDVDSFAGPRTAPLRVLANRGVNGIDGQVSAALGAAAAWSGPTVLWCGDLALLHDLGGLLAGRLHGDDLTIVASNDDGGGIFEYLPVAQAIPRSEFESLFAVSHGLDLAELGRGLGWQGVRVGSRDEFAHALQRALQGGRHLIEVPIDRAANTALHGALAQAVRDRLQAEWRP
ncbi:MAG TPA: 2-succinyl-5-enolpyruvyl-6-hydroxy-3-cyclohexene-1-carboxylic-acid synthase [Steroidobacteraceae bacterium]|nr:2-succinyl-5-enolpyruvyl-6-hydroxy-3-cyclohexene-1-carboxylic-acid synthase [Steroidobacteraceae bacterium]